MTQNDWYFLLLALVIIAVIVANELGYGVVALLPGLLLAYWLMTKAFADTP